MAASDGAATDGLGHPMIRHPPQPRRRLNPVLAALLLPVTAVVVLAAATASAAPPRAAEAVPATGPCDEPIARSQLLVSAAVIGGPVRDGCIPPPPHYSPTPTPTPSRAPSPNPKATAGSAAANRYCRVALRLPASAVVRRPVHIRVQASDGCFTGRTRVLSTTLRRATGPGVQVSWTSRGGRHDVVLRHGVPRPGRWRLDLVSGAGLAAEEIGTLVAR